jgi:hypothetical protein
MCVKQAVHVHITIVEDTEETFIERLVACLTDLPVKVIRDSQMWTEEQYRLIKKAESDIAQYVAVQFCYGQSIDVVHQKKMDYETMRIKKGLPPPLVDIVDYTGHIAGKSFGDKKFEKMITAYTARKDYALSTNKIVFDFAQVNRDGGKKALDGDGILTITELAGAFDISHVCDNIISINRNDEDNKNKTTRLHICKSRNGDKGVTAKYAVDFSRARHLSQGDEGYVEFPLDFHGNSRGAKEHLRSDARSEHDKKYNS